MTAPSTQTNGRRTQTKTQSAQDSTPLADTAPKAGAAPESQDTPPTAGDREERDQLPTPADPQPPAPAVANAADERATASPESAGDETSEAVSSDPIAEIDQQLGRYAIEAAEPSSGDSLAVPGQPSATAAYRDPASLNLAQLHAEAQEIWGLLLENLADPDALEPVLDALQGKVDATAWVNDTLEAEIAAAKARFETIVGAMQQHLRTLQSAQQQLHGRLLHWHAVGLLPEESLGSERTLKFQNYPVVEPRVEAKLLPDRFRRDKVEVRIEPDKTALKQALKAGDAEAAAYAELRDNFKPKFGFKTSRAVQRQSKQTRKSGGTKR